MKTLPLPQAPSAEEQRLFNFLLAVNEKYNLQSTLRVAGGWVRDRMLGTESHDIDIALDGPAPPDDEGGENFMTGYSPPFRKDCNMSTFVAFEMRVRTSYNC